MFPLSSGWHSTLTYRYYSNFTLIVTLLWSFLQHGSHKYFQVLYCGCCYRTGHFLTFARWPGRRQCSDTIPDPCKVSICSTIFYGYKWTWRFGLVAHWIIHLPYLLMNYLIIWWMMICGEYMLWYVQWSSWILMILYLGPRLVNIRIWFCEYMSNLNDLTVTDINVILARWTLRRDRSDPVQTQWHFKPGRLVRVTDPVMISTLLICEYMVNHLLRIS